MKKRGLSVILTIVTCVTSMNLYGCSLPGTSGNAGKNDMKAVSAGAVSGETETASVQTETSADAVSQKKKLKVVFTAGFKKNEVFRIDTESCMRPELMVYMVNMQNKYTDVYGKDICNTKADGVTFGESVRQNALARITRIKTMNLMAVKYHVALDGNETALAKAAAKRYYGSLSNEEIKELGVTEESIQGMYTEYALADKVYSYIIKDINPEVSDDEARTITVSQILIKTYSTTAKGKRTEYSSSQKAAAEKKCEEILAKIKSGADFDETARKYNEDTENTLSFGKGQADRKFEDAAFNLGKDEISGVVETADGYRIIKCITPFDKQQTEANKKNIVRKKRQEVFSKEYNSFAEPLTRCLNEKLWKNIKLTENRKDTTSDFFETYRKYFPDDTDNG